MGKYIESDIQIRFADADSLGHINNVNLQHYFDVGKMEFYEKVLGKTIDPDAFMTVGSVMGVYGKGFQAIGKG